jgi:hypothetical protein
LSYVHSSFLLQAYFLQHKWGKARLFFLLKKMTSPVQFRYKNARWRKSLPTQSDKGMKGLTDTFFSFLVAANVAAPKVSSMVQINGFLVLFAFGAPRVNGAESIESTIAPIKYTIESIE